MELIKTKNMLQVIIILMLNLGLNLNPSTTSNSVGSPQNGGIVITDDDNP